MSVGKGNRGKRGRWEGWGGEGGAGGGAGGGLDARELREDAGGGGVEERRRVEGVRMEVDLDGHRARLRRQRVHRFCG